ncbi:MAG: 2-dehydropantoate 2-reductase [Alphaproteobacteria bacterium]|nr:2-dehydropantoate 2-reductase [Alphaproteobacteria bacterium]
MKILVLGVGGIGGFFGGYLHEIGADVTFLVRPKRRALLQANGLRIISPLGNLNLDPKLVLSDELKPVYDIILISCKTYDLDQAMIDLRPTKGRGLIIPFLNGVTHMKKLDEEFGQDNVMGGVAHISSTVNKDGTIEHFSEFKKLTFGNRDLSKNNALKEFAEVCAKTQFDMTLSDDINLDLWKKWVFISTVAGATTLFSCSLGEIVKSDFGKQIIIDLFNECRSIAKLYKYDYEDSEADIILKTITTPGSPIKASMQRDVEKKSFTEHEQIFGDLINKGQKYSFDCPILMSCYVRMNVYQRNLT